jgi:hypothetical protein
MLRYVLALIGGLALCLLAAGAAADTYVSTKVIPVTTTNSNRIVTIKALNQSGGVDITARAYDPSGIAKIVISGRNARGTSRTLATCLNPSAPALTDSDGNLLVDDMGNVLNVDLPTCLATWPASQTSSGNNLLTIQVTAKAGNSFGHSFNLWR